MSAISTEHDTVVIKRSYAASPQRVFAAWGDPNALVRWYTPGDESWTAQIVAHDFRVGGAKQIIFGPRDEAQYHESGRYEDIVTDRRLCYSMTISRADQRLTTSMVTVDVLRSGNGTEVIVTDQLVILDGGDTATDREKGWGETLDKLAMATAL